MPSNQLVEQLSKQVLAVLLYNRRFHRITKPSLDILSSLLQISILSILQHLSRFPGPQSFPSLLEELLRYGRRFYLDKTELLEYIREVPKLEVPSVLEERGLVSGQLKLLLDGKVDPKLLNLDLENNRMSIEME